MLVHEEFNMYSLYLSILQFFFPYAATISSRVEGGKALMARQLRKELIRYGGGGVDSFSGVITYVDTNKLSEFLVLREKKL